MGANRPAVICTDKEIPCDSAAFAKLSVSLLALGKALRFKARGRSMHPLVRDGDVLLVQPVDPRSIRVGDLVFFRNPRGEIVVHRVIRRYSGNGSLRFRVKGDGLARADGVVSDIQVLGRVSSTERDGLCMDLDRPLMRFLGLTLAVLAPLRANRIGSIRFLKALVRNAPLLSRYLA